MHFRLILALIILLSLSGLPARLQDQSCLDTFADFTPIHQSEVPIDRTQQYSGRAMAWFTDSQCMLIGSSTGLWLYDIGQPAVPVALTRIDEKGIYSLAVNPLDSTIAFAIHEEPVVYLIDTDGTWSSLDVYGQIVNDILFSPDGSFVAIASSDFHIEARDIPPFDPIVGIWDLETNRQTHTISLGEYFVADVDLATDNHRMLTRIRRSGYLGDIVDYWDIETESKLWTYYELTRDLSRRSFDPVVVMTTTMLGHTVAIGGLYGFYNDHEFLGNGIDIWNMAHQEPQIEVIVNSRDNAVPDYALISIDFNSDGSVLASLTEDGTINLWNPADGTEIAAFKVQTEGATRIAFSPDDRWLAILADGQIIIWDMEAMTQYTAFSLN